MALDGLALSLCGLGSEANQAGDTRKAHRCYREAERAFNKAIYWATQKDKPKVLFYANLGEFLIGQKRWQEALDAFEKASKEDPKYLANYWGTGQVLMKRLASEDTLNCKLRNALNLIPPEYHVRLIKLLKM